MGLFDILKGKKKKAEEKLKRPSKGVLKRPDKPIAVAKKEEVKSGTKEQSSELASRVILAPHVTEKTTLFSEKGIYVFKISKRANKTMVGQAIKELYGFESKKVSIINVPSKIRSSRGKKGVKSGYKKAMVYLKEGDKIDLA